MRSVIGTLLAAIGGILIGWAKEEFGFRLRTLPDGATELKFQPTQDWWILVPLGLFLILVGYLLSRQHLPRFPKRTIPPGDNLENT